MWLLLLSILPAPDGVVRDSADVVEVNTVFDCQGQPTLEQVIWWDYSAVQGDYRVVAWRMLGDCASPVRAPGGYLTRWWDRRDKCRREVRSAVYRRTWTPHDPEVADREWLPCERRRGLRGK